jgi:predicted DNA-binding protein
MKEKFLQVRMTESEKNALKKLSDRKGISMSDYIRMKINDEFESYSGILAGKTDINPLAFPGLAVQG